jgi:hypothetical protein
VSMCVCTARCGMSMLTMSIRHNLKDNENFK